MPNILHQKHHVATARFIAGQLLQLQSPGFLTRIALSVNAQVGPVITSNVIQGNPGCPTAAYFETGDTVLLLINGSETLAQANSLWNGYFPSLLSNPINPSNTYIEDAAKSLATPQLRMSIESGKQLVIGGFSLGGAIGEVFLRNRLEAGVLQEQNYCTTFGAPKPGGERTQTLLGATCVRYFNSDDPVPFIPPQVSVAPALLIVLPLRTIAVFQFFLQPSGGIQIKTDFGIAPGVLPTEVNVPFPAAVGAWILSMASGATSPHSLTTYIGRMDTWLARNTEVHRQNVQGGGREPRNPANRSELNRAQRAALAPLFAEGRNQNAVELAIPSAQEMFAIREGPVWIVVFRDTVIAVGPTKKRARAMARFGNEFLRRMQIQGVAEPSQFLQALSAYFTDATDPNGTFKPVMNTAFPT